MDSLAMSCIRRINLDAFWSLARSTVEGNARQVRHGLALCKRMGFSAPYLRPEPLPSFDHCGCKVAIHMVLSSLGAGRYSTSHKQWDTIRKFRSCYSNQVRASAIANSRPYSVADDIGKNYQRFAIDPCGLLWFLRFMEGCRRRMGQDWRPNRAISVDLMQELLAGVEDHIKCAVNDEERDKQITAGGYFCFCYVTSLRGSEGLLTDLAGLWKHYDKSKPYVLITLLGRAKGEHHSQQHLLPCVPITRSGINVKLWIERLLYMHAIKRRTSGPIFVDGKGYQSTTSQMNDSFLKVLGKIWERKPELFGPDIISLDDLHENYHVFRYLRLGSESR